MPSASGPATDLPSLVARRANPRTGLLLALGSTVAMATNFVTAKHAVTGLHPETFSFAWTTAAAGFALLTAAVGGDARVWRLPRQTVLPIGAIGVSTAASMLLLWHGVMRLDPTFASLLARSTPALSILGGVLLFGDRLRPAQVAAMLVMFAGAVLASAGRWDRAEFSAGTLMMLGACTLVALQQILAKLVAHRVNTDFVAFWRLAGAAPLLGVWILATGKTNFHAPASCWAATLIGAFLGPCFSHILLFRSYRYWPFTYSGIVQTAQPLFVLPLALVFLGRFPTEQSLAGGAVILSGGVWLALLRRKPEVLPPAPTA